MEYSEPKFQKFVDDMERDGRIVLHYTGRHFYEGPSVEIERSELQTIIRATGLELQWDSLGKSGLVVYPV